MAPKRIHPQRKPARPPKFRKNRTGYYTVAAVERALQLRKADTSAWRSLPRNLRTQAAEYDRFVKAETPRVEERIELMRAHIEAEERQAEKRIELVRAASNVVHPKVREVAQLVGSLGDLPFEDVAKISAELAPYLKVPGKRGRKVRPETLKRIAVIKKRKAEGVSLRKIAREIYPDVPVETAERNLLSLRRTHHL